MSENCSIVYFWRVKSSAVRHGDEGEKTTNMCAHRCTQTAAMNDDEKQERPAERTKKEKNDTKSKSSGKLGGKT